MDNKRGKIVVFISIVIFLELICAVVLLNNDDSDVSLTSSNDVINNNTSSNYNTSESLSLVKDYDIFFTINNIVNNYYDNIIANNSAVLLNTIDKSYIINNQIDENNIFEIIKNSYTDITYYSKEMYTFTQNSIKYFFITGELQGYDFSTKIIKKEENINFLVSIYTNTGGYSITPVATTDIEEYAKSYKIIDNKTIELNSDNEYSLYNIQTNKVIVYYMNYFKNMLYLDTESAYNMLADEYKKTFTDYEDFSKNIKSIYDMIDTNILTYAESEDEKPKKLSANMTGLKRIVIYENSIMNFKVLIEDQYAEE